MAYKIIRPTGTVDTNWAFRDYTAIDDVVEEPTVPTLGTGEIVGPRDKADEETFQEWNLGDIPAETDHKVTTVQMWYYFTNPQDASIDEHHLKIGGTWLTPEGGNSWYLPATGWRYVSWGTGGAYLMDSAITNNAVKFKSSTMSNGDLFDIGCVYVKVNHEYNGAGLPILSGPHSPFFLFLEDQ